MMPRSCTLPCTWTLLLSCLVALRWFVLGQRRRPAFAVLCGRRCVEAVRNTGSRGTGHLTRRGVSCGEHLTRRVVTCRGYSTPRGVTCRGYLIPRGVTCGEHLTRRGLTCRAGCNSYGERHRTPADTRGLWYFSLPQLRRALASAGFLEPVKDWNKRRLIRALLDMRIPVSEVRRLAGAEIEQAPAGDRARRHKPGKSQPKAPQGSRRDEEAEWLKEDFLGKGSYEDEYWEERSQRYDGGGRHGRARGGRDGRSSSFGGEDFGSFDEGSWEGGGWDAEDEAWYQEFVREPGTGRGGRRQGWKQHQHSEDSRDDFVETSSGRVASSSPSAGLQPDEVMAHAIRDVWDAEHLSRHQASLLLGISVRPTAAEMTQARRRLVLRWHPDQNPGDSQNAASALRLVMGACKALS